MSVLLRTETEELEGVGDTLFVQKVELLSQPQLGHGQKKLSDLLERKVIHLSWEDPSLWLNLR